MNENSLNNTTALVTGASRGFGRAIAIALHDAGAEVVAVARNADRLAELRAELGDSITTIAADVSDPTIAGSLIERFSPRTLVLNAGAAPLMRPIHQYTWETFSRNWDVDVKQAFHWIREALLLPLAPQSTVITFSSGAARFGSPLSGSYAGAKAAVRFITDYAAEESGRAGHDIRFVSVLPKLTVATDLGVAAAEAYARRYGVDLDEYVRREGPALEPVQVGRYVVALALSADRRPGTYLFGPNGMSLLE